MLATPQHSKYILYYVISLETSVSLEATNRELCRLRCFFFTVSVLVCKVKEPGEAALKSLQAWILHGHSAVEHN